MVLLLLLLKYNIIIITFYYVRVTIEWALKTKNVNSNQYKFILLIYCS